MRRIVSLFLVGICVSVLLAQEEPAGEALSPKQAFEAMNADVQAAFQARDYAKGRALQRERPQAFLAEWEKTGRTASGEDLLFLGQFYMLAQRRVDAMKTYRVAVADETLTAEQRAKARVQCARALSAVLYNKEIDEKETARAIQECEESVAAMKDQPAQQGSLLQILGRIYSNRHDRARAVDLWTQAARTDARLGYACARDIAWELLGGATRMEQYRALQERAEKLLTELKERYAKYAAGNASAERNLARFDSLLKPFGMLGRPAEAWTLERAFADVKSIDQLEGKVVLLDFWATWCPWCIKSFPAIRDLLKRYEGKDFVVVGVTAPASSVYASRYSLDEDLKGKGADARALRFPRQGSEEEQAAFRVQEKETIAKFIENHEMTWPVVMIDPAEPARKYALTGWPHAVFLDRKGRIRSFKRGALLREKAEAVAKVQALIDALLAEQ